MDLEELVGFLLLGSVNHKAEVGSGKLGLAGTLMRQELSAWRGSQGRSSPGCRGNFNVVNFDYVDRLLKVLHFWGVIFVKSKSS